MIAPWSSRRSAIIKIQSNSTLARNFSMRQGFKFRANGRSIKNRPA